MNRLARAAVADDLFELHNAVNKAVSAAVQAIMNGGDVETELRRFQLAVQGAMRQYVRPTEEKHVEERSKLKPAR